MHRLWGKAPAQTRRLLRVLLIWISAVPANSSGASGYRRKYLLHGTKIRDLTHYCHAAKILMLRGQMIIVRTLFAIILAVSLAALPARVGAIGISVGTDMAAAGMPD